MNDKELLDMIELLLKQRRASVRPVEEPTMEAELKSYLSHPWKFKGMRDKKGCADFCNNPRNWALRYSEMSEQQRKWVRGFRMYMDRFNGEQS